MRDQKNDAIEEGKVPQQRKTTLKWGTNGELSAVDMARILDRLKNPKLTECDISRNNKQ